MKKLKRFFLYSEDGKELYRYKAIDEPMAFSDDGIFAEMHIDKDILLIAIEDPQKNEFHFIFYKEQK